jgi:hypothetical protein
VGQLAQVFLFVGQGEVNHRSGLLFVRALSRLWSAAVRDERSAD